MALVATVAIAAAITTTAVSGTSSSQAAGLLSTTTTVTVAPSPAGLYREVKITATIKLLGVLPGLLITPTGSVAFRSAQYTGGGIDPTLIGSAPVGTCLLTTCTATVYTSNLATGPITVSAAYSGDSLAKGSSGAGAATIDLTSYTNSSSVPCAKTAEECDAGLIRSNDGSTYLFTAFDGTTGTAHTLNEALDVTPAPSACNAGGVVAQFTDTPDVTGYKDSYYTVTDPTEAAALIAENAAHPDVQGCFESTSEFNEFDGSSLAPAPAVVESDGTFFEGPLPSCTLTSGAAPCFNFDNDDQYFNANPNDVQIDVKWENGIPGDPKYTPK